MTRLPAAFLRGRSLQPLLRVGKLNSRSRRGSRGAFVWEGRLNSFGEVVPRILKGGSPDDEATDLVCLCAGGPVAAVQRCQRPVLVPRVRWLWLCRQLRLLRPQLRLCRQLLHPQLLLRPQLRLCCQLLRSQLRLCCQLLHPQLRLCRQLRRLRLRLRLQPRRPRRALLRVGRATWTGVRRLRLEALTVHRHSADFSLIAPPSRRPSE